MSEVNTIPMKAKTLKDQVEVLADATDRAAQKLAVMEPPGPAASQEPQAVEDFNVDDLIAVYSVPGKSFTVRLPGGHVFTVRPLKDASEKLRIEAAAKMLIEDILGSEICPVEWQPYKDTDPQIVEHAVFLSAVLLKPRMGQLELLKFAQQAGPGFTRLALEVMAGSTAPVFREEMRRVDEAKNDSRQILSGEPN